MQGTIKVFHFKRGWGFIEAFPKSDKESDVFFHISRVLLGAYPVAGDRVEFEIGVDRKTGRSAAEFVRIIQ